MSTRTLHLVDMENLCQSPFPSVDTSRQSLASYLHVSEWHRGDVVVIAANRWLAKDILFNIPVPHIFKISPPGTNSADQVLTEQAFMFDSHRFDRLAIGSGDHHFARVVLSWREAGVEAMALSRHGCLSWVLRRSADEVRYLPSGHVPLGVNSI